MFMTAYICCTRNSVSDGVFPGKSLQMWEGWVLSSHAIVGKCLTWVENRTRNRQSLRWNTSFRKQKKHILSVPQLKDGNNDKWKMCFYPVYPSSFTLCCQFFFQSIWPQRFIPVSFLFFRKVVWSMYMKTTLSIAGIACIKLLTNPCLFSVFFFSWAFVMKKHLSTHLLGKHGVGQRKER